MKFKTALVFFISAGIFLFSFKIANTPTNIVEKAYYNVRSDCYSMNVLMKLVRPSWTRELSFKTWTKGAHYGMMAINSPVKDKGVSFLRIKSEGWNWLPNINRVIKISPSQMSQSWMGSDFTTEDLLKEASIVNDYSHALLTEEKYQGVNCYKIQATPKPNAAVVWSKVILWISKEDVLQRKVEYYDESNTLINTLIYSNFRLLGGKKIAITMEMVPSNKKGQKSVVTISSVNFNEKISNAFFSTKKMKTVR